MKIRLFDLALVLIFQIKDKWYLLLLLVNITITVAIHMNSDITAKCLRANHCSAADRIHAAVVC